MLAGALLLAAVASTVSPFTIPAEMTTTVAIAFTVGWGLAGGRPLLPGRGGRPRDDPSQRRAGIFGVAASGTLVAGVITLELIELTMSPRRDHPTLSSMLDALTRHEPLRGLVFLAWLVAGAWLCAVPPAAAPSEPEQESEPP